MKRIFGDIYDVKRIAPGIVVGIDNNIVHNDCTTLGGNSGSAILDAETGKVVALHYGGDIAYNNAVSVNIIKDRLIKI
jgi:endonuclease G, mitochondrial